MRQQQGAELLVEGQRAVAVLRLGRCDLRLIVGVGGVPAHDDALPFEVDILPAQSQHLAPPHAGEQQQRHEPALRERQCGDAVDDLPDDLRGQRLADF